MPRKKRKFEANTQIIQDAMLVPHHARNKDLADIQPIGYLSSLRAEDDDPLYTRDMVLRLIDRLKKK